MIAGMKIQLVCMLLLAFSSWSLCSGKQNRISQLPEVISFFSFVSKAHVPSWKMTLLNVCSLVNNLNSPAEETGEVHEEQLITRRKLPTALDGFSLEAMLTIYQLHKICHSRAFQHWELIQEDILDTGNDKNEKEEVIKRKIPYILKRQLYENKPRRPYILKRDSYYY
uniref:Neurotensin/neuromedin N n=1 Tax=Rhinopithecus bieti TaxID=61621 RepID=A0A2K6LQE0_RHIBE